MSELDTLQSLAVALALGLLIGLQREWRTKTSAHASFLSAGLRTFGLIGLLGGLTAMLAEYVGMWLIGLGFAGIALLFAVAYFRHSGNEEGIGLTTEIAALITFALGVTVLLGHIVLASVTAVVVTFFLGLKPTLHHIVEKLEREEFYATLKLLLISVVLLPILPNRGYGPWDVLNPYEIWWMVVLIAAISFVGYFAMKIGGARHGAILTGLFGGLVSSTAVTLSLSRYARTVPNLSAPLASGILAACSTMFLRILLVASALAPDITRSLLFPLGTVSLVIYAFAFYQWRRSGDRDSGPGPDLQNPFQFATALKFGLLLTAILLLARALTEWLDQAGLYLLAAVSGITDVDAITLSVSRMSLGELPLETAVMAILIAAAVNSLVKIGMSIFIGGFRFGTQVALPLGTAMAGGCLVWLLF